LPIQNSISNAIKGDAPLGGVTPPFNQYSFEFDGNTDYVTMGDVLDMANDGTDAFTISCWFKTTDTATQILIGKQINTTPYNGYNLYLSSNRIKFSFGTLSGLAYIQGQSSNILSTITDGNWHHLVITYDGTQDITGFNLYYDNSPIAITALNNNTPTDVSSSAEFMLGARGTTSSYGVLYDGILDEVAYFNSELSASDISTIYGTGTPSDLSSLSPISWWRMGDAATWTGKTWDLTDQGSGGNDGFSDTIPGPPAQPSTDIPT
jgi:hypothetical protein